MIAYIALVVAVISLCVSSWLLYVRLQFMREIRDDRKRRSESSAWVKADVTENNDIIVRNFGKSDARNIMIEVTPPKILKQPTIPSLAIGETSTQHLKVGFFEAAIQSVKVTWDDDEGGGEWSGKLHGW